MWADTKPDSITAQPRSITWTPDSGRFVFVRQEGKLTQVSRSELWSIPAEGGEPVRLGFSATGRLGRFSIHPDGKRIVFSLGEDVSEVWVMENFPSAAPGAGR